MSIVCSILFITKRVSLLVFGNQPCVMVHATLMHVLNLWIQKLINQTISRWLVGSTDSTQINTPSIDIGMGCNDSAIKKRKKKTLFPSERFPTIQNSSIFPWSLARHPLTGRKTKWTNIGPPLYLFTIRDKCARGKAKRGQKSDALIPLNVYIHELTISGWCHNAVTKDHLDDIGLVWPHYLRKYS